MASPRNDPGPQLSHAGHRVILWNLVGVSVLFTGVAWLVHPLLELADPVPADRLLAVLALFALLEYVGFRPYVGLGGRESPFWDKKCVSFQVFLDMVL